MPHVSRFKRRNSDRSGFKYWETELIRLPSGMYVHPDEYDIPPPSKKSLGGEGDIGASELRPNSDFDDGVSATTVSAAYDNPVVYVTAAGGVRASFVHPWMRITGSNNAITVSANPQVTRGRQGQVLTLECVGSSITLSHGNGLNMMNSQGLIMDSGSIITFIYTTGGTVWNETSRGRKYEQWGGF